MFAQKFFAFGVVGLVATGCLPYLYNERAPALIENIDIDQTLRVAEVELLELDSGFDVLTIWAIRDQKITPSQASRINDLYLKHIDQVDADDLRADQFGVWHFTWAISNLYRFGDDEVKAALEPAYRDALERVETVDREFAVEHVKGTRMYTGLAHIGGKSYARDHVVAPGNEDYLQSFEQYKRERQE